MWKITVLALVICCYVQPGWCSFGEARVVKNKLNNANMLRHVRPVRDAKDAVQVTYGLTLRNILRMDVEEQTVTISVWEDMTWESYYLAWSPDNYDNVTTVALPADAIWVPDIMLFNRYGAPPGERNSDYKALVRNTGRVNLVRPSELTVRCKPESSESGEHETEEAELIPEPSHVMQDTGNETVIHYDGEPEVNESVIHHNLKPEAPEVAKPKAGFYSNPNALYCEFVVGSWTQLSHQLSLVSKSWDPERFEDSGLYVLSDLGADWHDTQYPGLEVSWQDITFYFKIY